MDRSKPTDVRTTSEPGGRIAQGPRLIRTDPTHRALLEPPGNGGWGLIGPQPPESMYWRGPPAPGYPAPQGQRLAREQSARGDEA